MKGSFLHSTSAPVWISQAFAPRAQRCSRLQVSCAAQLEKYKSPSSSTASTELEYLESYTTVVPDTLLLQNIEQIEAPKAATVSSAVLAGILRTPGGLQEYKVRGDATGQHKNMQFQKGLAILPQIMILIPHLTPPFHGLSCVQAGLCLQFAIENAINYDKCHSKSGPERLGCLLNKATVNIGTLFSKQVEGRVSTEVSCAPSSWRLTSKDDIM